MGERERREGLFDLSEDAVAAMEDDGWELVGVARHIGQQHAGVTEYVFERDADARTRRLRGKIDLYWGDDRLGRAPH